MAIAPPAPSPGIHMVRTLSCAGAFCAALVLIWGCDDSAYRPGRGPVRTQVDDGMPDWVNNPPLNGRLVVGVGADPAHSEHTAFLDGTNDIARQLHIVILPPSVLGAPLDASGGAARAQTISPDATPNDDTASALLQVDSSTLPTLAITKRADTSRCLYLQVTLDREAWAENLRHRLGELDRQILAIRTSPETAQGRPIATAARRYLSLLPVLVARERTARELQVADPVEQGPPAPMTLSSLHEQFAQVLEQVSVEINASPELDAIMPQLAGSCANLGLHLANGQPNPSLRLRLSLQSSLQQIDGVERLNARFDAITILGRDGQEIGSFGIDLRASGQAETAARDRMMTKILASWTDYLEHDFITCLTRL